MAQPTWVTPAGTLGTIPEGVFYQTPIEAIDPALTLAATNFTYSQGQVTLTFSIQFATPFGVGSTVTIAGFTPSTYNGTYTVTRGTQTSVSFVHSNDGVPTVLGVISNTPSTVYYELIAGKLPAGIQNTCWRRGQPAVRRPKVWCTIVVEEPVMCIWELFADRFTST